MNGRKEMKNKMQNLFKKVEEFNKIGNASRKWGRKISQPKLECVNLNCLTTFV